MFQIINVITDESFEVIAPHFVKMTPAGLWVHCYENEADALALHARIFRILGNAGDTFYVEPLDSDAKINAVLESSRQRSDDLTGAVFDLDAERADIVNAIFELDKRLEGFING